MKKKQASGGKKEKGPCENRREILEAIKSQLAEHFDAGVGIVCYEQSAETHFFTFQFGNSFAVEAMGNKLQETISESSADDDGDEEEEED
jgi:hypothetical protein